MVGNADAQLAETRNSLRRLADTQEAAMDQGRADVEKLENKYDKLERSMKDAREETRGMRMSFGSLATMAAGAFAAFHGGKTFLDLTVGAADDMERRRKQLGEIFNDANRAMQRSRALTQEIASMSLGDAVKGMQDLGVKAGGSAERAGELVKLGKALEQLNPEQGFQGAVLAIKELASGETRSVVDRFNLSRSAFPDRSEAKRLARERGTTVQNVFFEALRGQLQERGGVEKLLQIDRDSLRGQMQMLETAGRDLLRTIGDEALPEVTEGVNEAATALRDLQDDEEFREAAKDFGEFIGDGAESLADAAPVLIDKLPAAMQAVEGTFTTIKDFYDAHPTLVKVAAGLFAANTVTGGALGSLGGGLLSGGGSAVGGALSGVGGGKCCEGIDDAADTLDDVASGASSGGRGFLQKTLMSAGGSGAAASFTEATMAAITPSAIGSIAATAAPFALGAFGLSSFADAKGDPTETTSDPITSKSKTTNALRNQLTQGKFGAARRSIIDAAGGSPEERLESRAQMELLESVNNRLESFGLQANLKKGQKFKNVQFQQAGGIGHELGTFGGLADTELSDISDMNASQAVEALNSGTTINGGMKVEVNGVEDPETVKKAAKQGAKDGLSEAQRKERARR